MHSNEIEERLSYYKDGASVEKEVAVDMLTSISNGYLQPQYDRDGNMFLNPDGVVSRAEVIHALTVGQLESTSIDGVSQPNDYFNKGYNDLVRRETDNFYNVYSKDDINKGIRRFELAYMLASHRGIEFGEGYDVEDSISYLYEYEDILDIGLEVTEDIENLLPKEQSIENYIKEVQNGVVKLNVHLACLTSDLLSLVPIKELELKPLKQVSRLEFTRIALSFE